MNLELGKSQASFAHSAEHSLKNTTTIGYTALLALPLIN